MRILLIRLRQIGDVVFTTPAVRGLRRRFPDAFISYLVEPGAAPVVATNAHINEVIVAPRGRGLRGVLAELALIGRLRRSRYDLAIDFHGGPRASLLTWLSGARVRVGYGVVGRSWMYTRRVPRPRELRARHSVENQWDLLEAIGIAPPDRSRDAVDMRVDGAADERVAERLAQAGVGSGDQLIVMHVSAGNPFRRWPLNAFAATMTMLIARDPRRRIVVTSGPSEQNAVGRVIAQARSLLAANERDRIVTCGEFSLAELRALVGRASLYIGGDSGPLHIAATSTVPIVGLYGPTLPARSAPWRAPEWITESVEVRDLECRPCDQRSCAPGDFRCLAWLRPEQVIEAAERALARAADHRVI